MKEKVKYGLLMTSLVLFVLIISFSKSASAEELLKVRPSGNNESRKTKELRNYRHSNLEPTGFYVKKGDKITIQATNVESAKVFLGQYGVYSNFNSGESDIYKEYELKNGENTIEMEDEVGQVYIENLSENKELEVSIKGGRKEPIFVLGKTTEKEFFNSLEKYKEAPFFELVGEHFFGTYQMSLNKEVVKQSKSVEELVEYLDNIFIMEGEALGLYLGGAELGIDSKSSNRIQLTNSDDNFMYAVNNRISASGKLVDILNWEKDDDLWGIWHEAGHTFQNPFLMWESDKYEGEYPGYSLDEVTVNLGPLYIQHNLGLPGRVELNTEARKNIEKFVQTDSETKDFDTASLNPEKELTETDPSVWIKLGMFNQLMFAYGDNMFSYIAREYRLMSATNAEMPKTNEEKRQCFMNIVSKVTKRDLSDYFKKWGLYPNEEVKKQMAKFEKPRVPIEENLFPGKEDPIVDEEMDVIEVPIAKPIENIDFTLGATASDFNVTKLLQPGSEKYFPSGKTELFKKNVRVVNDLLENSEVKVELTNAQGTRNELSIPVKKSYGNAISMHAYYTEERAIFTLQKKSKTIESFTDEQRITATEAEEGKFVDFQLFDKNGKIKKEASLNKEDAPQGFVHSLRGIAYENGDIVKITIEKSGKLQSYIDGEIDLKREDSTKNEYFKIKNDQFIHLSDDQIVPSAKPKNESVYIGDRIPSPFSFVQDIKNLFEKDSVEATFVKPPKNNTVGEQEVSVQLTDMITGSTSKVTSKLTVEYGNSLVLAAYSATDVRTVLRLNKDGQRFVGYANPERETVLASSEDKYWGFKLIREGQVIKETEANGNETPFKFAEEIQNLEYQENDIVYIYHEEKILENYQESIKQEENYGTDNYFKISKDEFIKVENEDIPTLIIENERILYEKNESVTEKNLLSEIKAVTESQNTLKTDFNELMLEKSGNYPLTVTAINPITNEKVSKEIILMVTEPAVQLEASSLFTDGNPLLTLNEPKEIQLTVTNKSVQESIAESIDLQHSFKSNQVTLEKTIYTRKNNEEWKEQTISDSDSFTLSVPILQPNEKYEVKYSVMASEVIQVAEEDKWKINYRYTNKVEEIEKNYQKELDCLVALKTQDEANEGATNVTKNTKITFIEESEPGFPVHPDNPNQEVEPNLPGKFPNDNYGNLMITYASDFHFGTRKKGEQEVYATADSILVNDQEEKVTPFVSIQDFRGTDRQGWALLVRQETPFVNTDKHSLLGVELSLTNLYFAEKEKAPTASEKESILSTDQVSVATADSLSGYGRWSLGLGELIENQLTNGVKLSVPKGTVMDTATYKSVIEWELVEDPTLTFN